MEAPDLPSAALAPAGVAAEGCGAALRGVPGSTDAGTAGDGAAVPIPSGEAACCEGLRVFWAKPEATVPAANTIPKTQPSNVRVFI